MQDKKKIVIGALCALIMIMAVGYALLSQQLSINGSASITSTWKIEITNITEKERHGGVTEKSKSYDAMTANFDAGFTSPGDYIIYEVEVTNSGTLDAVIERINVVTNDNPAIIYTTSGIKRGDVIEHNSKKYLTVKIEYDSSVTSQPQTNNNALTLQLFTAQNLGQVEPEYQTYSVGDKITFAGSDWYVIKDSTADEDYVTLMKEKILTHDELGNDYSYKYTCTIVDVSTYHREGCSEIGHVIVYDTMSYYWGADCHNQDDIYGTTSYENYDESGCEGHNDYDKSKIKEFLEGTYINKLDASKLKEIDSYKIRLIKLEELQQNLGVSTTINNSWYDIDTSDALKWVYQNIGNGGYFTMTPTASSNVFEVFSNGRVFGSGILSNSGVRPVINLYKSAIE